MTRASRIVIVIALASIGFTARPVMAGEQLIVIVGDSTITPPAYINEVVPGQVVGGPVFFYDNVGGYPHGWTLSGVARLRWQDQHTFGYFPTGALAFVPDLPQVTAVSNGTFVDVTFAAMPLDIAQPDPTWGSRLTFGHWSWPADPAATGLTLWPEFELGNLMLTYTSTAPWSPQTYPLNNYGMSGYLYHVVPAPTCGAAFIGAFMLAASRRRRR